MATVVASSPTQSPIGAFSSAFAVQNQLSSPASACNSKPLAHHEVDHLRKVLAKSHAKTKAKDRVQQHESVSAKSVKEKVMRRKTVKKAIADDEVLIAVKPGMTVKICKGGSSSSGKDNNKNNEDLKVAASAPKRRAAKTTKAAAGSATSKDGTDVEKKTKRSRKRSASESTENPKDADSTVAIKPKRSRKLPESDSAKPEASKPKTRKPRAKKSEANKENEPPNDKKPKRAYTRKVKAPDAAVVGVKKEAEAEATDELSEKKQTQKVAKKGKTVKFANISTLETPMEDDTSGLQEAVSGLNIKSEVPTTPEESPEPMIPAETPHLNEKKLKFRPPPLDLSAVNDSSPAPSPQPEVGTSANAEDARASCESDAGSSSSAESGSETSTATEEEGLIDQSLAKEKIDQYEAIQEKMIENLEKIGAKKEKPKLKIEEVRATKKQIAKKLKNDKKLYKAVDKMSKTVAKYFNPEECDTEDSESSSSCASVNCECGECSDSDDSSEETSSCSGCSDCLGSSTSSESDWDF